MSPQEFYDMDIEDFILKSNGFLNARDWLEEKIRRATGLIQFPHVTKNSPSMMDQWPMRRDKENRKKHTEHVSQKNLKALKMHAMGGFEYVLENGKIMMKQTNKN